MDIATELQTALESLVTAYKAACASPKPNVTLDGKTVAWGDYIAMLSDAMRETSKLLGTFDPVELRSSIL